MIFIFYVHLDIKYCYIKSLCMNKHHYSIVKGNVSTEVLQWNPDLSIKYVAMIYTENATKNIKIYNEKRFNF